MSKHDSVFDRYDASIDKDVMKVCKELHSKLEECDYGIPKKDHKIKHVKDIGDDDFQTHYHFLSPKEFEQYQCGVCWDYVEWSRQFLDEHHIRSRCFYIITETPPNYDTHTFIVAESNGKYIWIESAFKKLSGIRVYDNIKDIVKIITWKMFDVSKRAKKMHQFKYSVLEYGEQHPPYGCTCEAYMDWMAEHGKFIFDDVAKPELPKGVVFEEGYRHSIYDDSYSQSAQAKKVIQVHGDLLYMRKNLNHMTKTECINKLCATYNILAEVFDTIKYDYTEDRPVKTSRLGFAKKPKKTSKHRDEIDSMIVEIRYNISELAKNCWTREGVKKVIDKMLTVWEYENRELNTVRPVGNRIAGDLVDKISHKVLEKIMDGFVDSVYDDWYQEGDSVKKRLNDKGETVPETCDKCGYKIGLFIKGEPIWECANPKCKKYFGTLPCRIQESVDVNDLKQQTGEVYQQALQIKYGCMNGEERITASPFKESWKMIANYKSQSIESVKESKIGVCFEHSFYVAELLKQRGLPYQTFFLNVNILDEQNPSSQLAFWHQFTIVPNDADSVVLIETSLTPDKNGVFLVKNMDDAIQHLIKSFGVNLTEEQTEHMKQDLIDVSHLQPADGITYLGYINNVYRTGKAIKSEIKIKHRNEMMKTYWEYLHEHHGCLSEYGQLIYQQIHDLDEDVPFELYALMSTHELFTPEGNKFHEEIGLLKPEVFFTLTPKKMESKLKGFIQESYMGNRTNHLKEDCDYIPLTPKSAKQYADQGVFKFGLKRTRVTNNTHGAIYIDKSHVTVAYVAIEKKTNGERWITALEVSEEFQGHGYGIDLLQIAVDEFGAEYLSVNKKNEKAMNMYLRHGWSVYDESDHMFFMKLNKPN